MRVCGGKYRTLNSFPLAAGVASPNPAYYTKFQAKVKRNPPGCSMLAAKKLATEKVEVPKVVC